jgi:hypothetical protein
MIKGLQQSFPAGSGEVMFEEETLKGDTIGLFYDIKHWFIQKYLKFIITHRPHRVVSQMVFDFANGNWELMVSGPGDKRTYNLVETFINQLANQSREQIIVAIIHTVDDSGYVLGATNTHHYRERWFKHGTYEIEDAFRDICYWCRQENNYFIAKRKELRQ